MYTISLEATAWLRATAVGVVLPAEVQELRERLERTEAEQAALPAAIEVKTAEQFLAEGMDPIKAQAKASKLAEEADALEKAQRIARAGVGGAQFNLNRAIVPHRDELIVGIRPLVTAVIDRARLHAEQLARFAPAYAPGDIVRRGTPDDLLAWQAAQEIEKEFGLLISAWRSSFRGEASQPGARVDVREVPEAAHFWAHPELVTNPALNGTKLNRFGNVVAINPDVLNVAAESPEAVFQLATLGELRAIFDAMHAPTDSRRRGVTLI